MTDFLLTHLASIGLLLDIVGVSILFFVVVTIGEQVVLVAQDENKIRAYKKKRKENILRAGYGLIFLGFALQLASNEMKSKIELTNEQTKNVTTLKSNSNLRDYYYDSVCVLTGTLKIETYFGQPNYGESPSTDAREDAYILTLDNSINVIQESAERSKLGIDVTKLNQYKIQLGSMNHVDIHSLVNRKIKVTGTFFGALTGHNHTPVLMMVTKAEEQ